jgi:hypothetical protein
LVAAGHILVVAGFAEWEIQLPRAEDTVTVSEVRVAYAEILSNSADTTGIGTGLAIVDVLTEIETCTA